jgi:LCP family protein required for cell wall assembly
LSPYPDDPREPPREEEGGDGLTEEFEAEFGDEFGADVEEELVNDEEPETEPATDPAGADAGASEAETTPDTSKDVSGSESGSEHGGSAPSAPVSGTSPTEQPAGDDSLEVLSQETVEADVLALGDAEEERERSEREAAEASAAAEEEEGAQPDEEEADEDEVEEAPEERAAVAAAVGAPSEEQPQDDKAPKVGLWARFLAASLVIVVAMATATSVSILLYLTDIAKGLGGIKGVQGQLEEFTGGPQTILVLGSDKRPDIEDAGRSDTTMLLRIDPDQDAIALLSLPRDLKVNIPGYGVGKLNDAYTVGGPKKTLEVVKQLTGIQIHHVVNVDFKGFEQAINAIDCVYVDVDRDYFHTNEGLAVSDYYSEIDINAGYQMLCGDRALQYVRYRHTDNDIVRAARQQDFLREARQKIGPSRLFNDRDELLKIFTRYTTSDIDDPISLKQVLETFLGAADAPVKQIHFQGTLGEAYVTASNEQIKTAVEQFLGIQDTPGSLGGEGEGGGGGGKKSKKKGDEKPKGEIAPELIDSAGAGVAFADRFAPAVGFPVFYPTKLVPGSQIIDESREYKLADEDKNVHTAYKLVFSVPGSAVPFEYYGLMGTTWTDPPIIDNPTETREIGGREYMLFYDGDRLRLVAWKTDEAAYWLNNTLTQTLEEDEMIAIADSMAEVAPPKEKKKKK